jgi:hypothetical protein
MEMTGVLSERHIFVLGEIEGRFASNVPTVFIASAAVAEVIDVDVHAWRIGDMSDGIP